jgi:hypothetical protein
MKWKFRKAPAIAGAFFVSFSWQFSVRSFVENLFLYSLSDGS